MLCNVVTPEQVAAIKRADVRTELVPKVGDVRTELVPKVGFLKSNSVMRLATATVETSSDYC
jgi:hypothetical protein